MSSFPPPPFVSLDAERFRQLALRMVAAREADRVHVAREIHDGLGQTLTSLALDAAWVARRLDAEDPSSADLRARLQEMVRTAYEGTHAARRIAQGLRPASLDCLGLVAACREEAEVVARRTGLRVEYEGASSVPRLDPAVETAAFRIVQEALTNVLRHAQASRVGVGVLCVVHRVTVWVADDGRGFDPDAARQGLGLLGIHERAHEHRGRIELATSPGGGTTLRAVFPLDHP